VIASIARARVAPAVDPLPVEDFQLRNGLRVLLAPDVAASSVVVHVRYEAGTASEQAGEAGYTALLAKLMSAGSVHVTDFDTRIEAVGGWSTTAATSDYLAATEQVPAHALVLVLWLEAERMAGLADGMTANGIATARAAVQAEWQAAYGEEPFALVTREVERALWTGELAARGNPVLGDGVAVKVADAEAVRRFARARLQPNNAILVVAGRFELAAAKQQVERYFGWIPVRDAVRSRKITITPHDVAIERVAKDPVAKVVVAFRCEPFDPAFEVAARLVSSQLQRLVDAKLASELHTELVRQRAGELRITALPAERVETAKLVEAIRNELATLRRHPPTPRDVARAAALVDAEFLVAVENVAVRADLLASWAVYGSGGGSLVSEWRRRLASVSAADMQGALAQWLAEQAAVIVSGRPEGP
jgi:zinc protease